MAKAVVAYASSMIRRGRFLQSGSIQNAATDERLLSLLVEDPLLLRTPIVRDGTRPAVGAAEPLWKSFTDAAKAAPPK